jgi:hypothetical protein
VNSFLHALSTRTKTRCQQRLTRNIKITLRKWGGGFYCHASLISISIIGAAFSPFAANSNANTHTHTLTPATHLMCMRLSHYIRAARATLRWDSNYKLTFVSSAEREHEIINIHTEARGFSCFGEGGSFVTSPFESRLRVIRQLTLWHKEQNEPAVLCIHLTTGWPGSRTKGVLFLSRIEFFCVWMVSRELIFSLFRFMKWLRFLQRT